MPPGPGNGEVGRSMLRSVLLRTLLFTLIVPGTVVVYIPLLLLRPQWPQAWGLLQWMALLLAGAGAGAYGWCAIEFALSGRGTPAPVDPPRKLVLGGLYGYSRNPMYVGILSVLVAEAAYFASWIHLLYAATVFGFFQSFVVFYEEPHLRRRFGEAYIRYCRAAPRWLVRGRLSGS